MNPIQMHAISSVTQPNNEDNVDQDTQRYQIQMPNQNLLHLVTQERPRATPLDEVKPYFISGLFGYCLGNAVAALLDSTDGWTTGAGVILSTVAGLYALTTLGNVPRNETGINKSYVVKHTSIFLLSAVSGCITNRNTFC